MKSRNKFLLMALLMFSTTVVPTTVNAQSILSTQNIQANNIFSNIGDFFGNMFGGSESTSSTGTIIKPDTQDAETTTAADTVKNTAIACAEDATCDTGTDIENLSNIDGLDIEKTMNGQTAGQTGQSAAEPLLPGDSVSVLLTVTNTGNMDNQTVTITDQITDANLEYNSAEVLTLTATTPGVTATTFAPADGTATIGDLVNAGVTVSGLDSGEKVTVAYNMTVKNPLDNLSTNQDTITNMATVCKNFDSTGMTAGSEYDYVHTNASGQPDGVLSITADGGTLADTLCDTDQDDLFIDTDGDGTIQPGINEITASKAVTDNVTPNTAIDGIANVDETLKYTITVTNESASEQKVIIKDTLDSLDHNIDKNVTFTPTEQLKQNDVMAFDVNGVEPIVTPATIADLQSGFKRTLAAGEVFSFSFTGKVNSTIDEFALEDQRIINQASVCQDKSINAQCENPEAPIPTTKLAKMVDMKKSVDITNLDEDADGNSDGDLTNNGEGAIAPGKDNSVLTYSIDVINKTNIDIVAADELVVKDTLPATYVSSDPTELLTGATNPTTSVVATNPAITADATTQATIGNLTNEGVAIDSLPAHTTFTISFTVKVNPEVFTDTLNPGNIHITNLASVCMDTDCTSDDAITTANPDLLPEIETYGIQKTVLDSDTVGTPGTPDGFADNAEILHYNFALSNDGTKNIILHLTDLLDDQSIDLAVSEANKLSLDSTKGRFVDPTGTPIVDQNSLTVKNLTEGIYVELAPGGPVNLSFDVIAKTENPDNSIDRADYIDNVVNACSATTDGTIMTDSTTDCTDSGASIPLVGVNFLELDKAVVDKEDGVADTDPLSSGDVANAVGQADAGETLTYTITAHNAGNKPLDFILHDTLVDSNIDYTKTVMDQVVVENGIVSTDATHTLQLLTTEGIEYSLEAGATLTVSFDAITSNRDATGVVNFPGEIIVNEAEAGYEDTEGNQQYANATAEIPTDLANPVEPDGSVLKDISAGNDVYDQGDGVADAKDTLTFTIAVDNPSDVTKTYHLSERAELDPNVNYYDTDTLAQDLMVFYASPEAKFVDASGADMTPVLSDLIGADNTATLATDSKVYASIPAHGRLVFTFTANIYDAFKVPATEITNKIESCYESTEGSETFDKCNENTAKIPTAGFEDLQIEKSVISSTPPEGNPDGFTLDADGNVVDATTPSTPPTPPTSPNMVAVDGGKVTYQIKVTNNGSIDLVDVTITDTLLEQFFTIDPAGTVSISEFTPDDVQVGSSIDATIADIVAGTTYPSLVAGNYLTLVFTMDVDTTLSDSLEEGEMISNLASVCYDSTLGLNADNSGTGNFCYDDGVDLPFITSPTAVIDPDDPTFAISKDIDAGEDFAVQPGEELNIKIDVTNTDFDNSGLDKTLTVTDEFIDSNVNYKASFNTAGSLVLKDTTSIAGAPGTPVVALLPDGTTAVTDTNAKIENLLPIAEKMENESAKTRYIDIPDSERGGITVTIPANHTIEFSFKVNAIGNMSNAQKIKNFFDWKRYF